MRSREFIVFKSIYRLYVWTGKNEAKTLRKDALFFENGEKKLCFQTNTDTYSVGK